MLVSYLELSNSVIFSTEVVFTMCHGSKRWQFRHFFLEISTLFILISTSFLEISIVWTFVCTISTFVSLNFSFVLEMSTFYDMLLSSTL